MLFSLSLAFDGIGSEAEKKNVKYNRNLWLFAKQQKFTYSPKQKVWDVQNS